MHMRQSISVCIAVSTISTLIMFITVGLLIILVHTVTSSNIPFDNDEANHAIDGWEVYHAFTNLNPADLYQSITNQGFYPPVHSLFVAAGYMFAGPSLVSSRIPTIIIFALTLLVLARLTYQIAYRVSKNDPSGSCLAFAGSAFAVSLAVTSEVFVSNSILCMLEMTGALFGMLLLFIVDQDETQKQSTRWIRLVSAAFIAIVIFLTKYSFGLFYLPGLLTALITITWARKASHQNWFEVAAVVVVYVVGLVLWLLVTDRDTMMLFFTNHSQYAPFFSAENLLYLPRVWLERYSTTLVIASISILLALIGLVRQWGELAVRVAFWSIVAAFVVLTISTTNEPRHILPMAPPIWMFAGLGLVEVLRYLQRHSRGEIKVIVVLISVSSLTIIGAIKSFNTLQTRLIDEFEGELVYSELQNYALQNVDLDQPVLFIGDFSDQNGLLAIRWRAATIANKGTWEMDIDYFPFGQHEHSISRTNRKPQIATVDSTIPRKHIDDVLATGHFGDLVEIRHIDNYFGPRADKLNDSLCGYTTKEEWFDDWVVIVYDIKAGPQSNCSVSDN